MLPKVGEPMPSPSEIRVAVFMTALPMDAIRSAENRSAGPETETAEVGAVSELQTAAATLWTP